jgi:hypothetical protein
MYHHNDLGLRNFLMRDRRDGQFNSEKKSAARFRQLPPEVLPQDIPRAKNIQLGHAR